MASTSAAEPSTAMKESPNWLEMPDELMVDIFKRLPTVEILNSARNVCTTWLKICKDPAMWKVINIPKPPVLYLGWISGLKALTKEAVDLSCGELIDISIEGFGINELLDYIVLRSNKLKRHCLVNCSFITDSAVNRAVKRVPQLEELDVSEILISAEEIKVIGRNCPHLKSFKMGNWCTTSEDYVNIALAISYYMPELRHLEVIGMMTNDGLEAIRNGCPHLQSLDVCGCYKLDLDGYLGKLCMERIKDFKHGSIENRGFHLENFEVEDFSDSEMYDDFPEDFFEVEDFFEDYFFEGED